MPQKEKNENTGDTGVVLQDRGVEAGKLVDVCIHFLLILLSI